MLAAAWTLLHPLSSAYAENVNKTDKITLGQKENNVQVVVSALDGAFEVDLEMPDGTLYKHDNYDASKVLYFEPDNGRSWLINEAPAGEYKVHIAGPAQDYSVSVEHSLRKPVTDWKSPKNQEVTIAGQSLDVQWSAAGDWSAEDRIAFYLQSSNGWQRMPIGEAYLSAGAASIPLPNGIPDGEYQLTALADNATPDGQAIDPKVKVVVRRGISYSGIEVTKITPRGGSADIDFTAPSGLLWSQVSAQWRGGAASGFTTTTEQADLLVVSDDESSGIVTYRLPVKLPADGKYTGRIQLVFADGTMTLPADIPEFRVANRDWSKDTATWSIEQEATNSREAAVTLNLQADAVVQVLDGKNILYAGEAKATNGAAGFPITLPLAEGDHLIEVLLTDPGGSYQSFSHRYLVDFTPPLLTMIQPQSTHKRLIGHYASGMTEKGAVILVGGKEYKPDDNGYFRIDGIGKELNLVVRDAQGNETSYHWSRPSERNKLLLFFISLNTVLVGGTIVAILLIRKNQKKS